MLLLTAGILGACGGGGGGGSNPPPGTQPPGTNPGPTNPPPTTVPPISGPLLDPELPFVQKLTIDGFGNVDTGECTAIAVSNDGTVHIVYFSETDDAPMHIHCKNNCGDPVSSGWSAPKKIDLLGTEDHPFGRDINLVIDTGNRLHVSYRDETEGVTNHVDTGDGVGIIKYAFGEEVGTDWIWTPMLVEDTLDSVSDTYIDVTADQIHISYSRKATPSVQGSKDALIYASCVLPCQSLSLWDITVVDEGKEAGTPNHITVADGVVHISYYSDGKLKYAACALSSDCLNVNSWSNQIVDQGSLETGRDNSLAVGADGSIHLTYMDNGNGNNNGDSNDTGNGHPYLKYASCSVDCTSGDPAVWKNIPVDGFDNVNDGNDNRISVGRSSQLKLVANQLHISYVDRGEEDLKYATCLLSVDANCLSASKWSRYRVDADANPRDTYLVIEPDNTVHFSYRDAGINRDLKYAFGSVPGQ